METYDAMNKIAKKISSIEDVASAEVKLNYILFLTKYHDGFALWDTTLLSVYEVAIECGYSEESHFSRVFKKQTGCSPTDYRRMKRNRTP